MEGLPVRGIAPSATSRRYTMSVQQAVEALNKAARNWEMGLITDKEYTFQVKIVLLQLI